MPDIRPMLKKLDAENPDIASQLEVLKQYSPKFADITEEEYALFREKIQYPLPKRTQVSTPKPKSINIIEAIRPFVATGATLAGSAAGTALSGGNPLVGRAAGLGAAGAVDFALQSLEGNDREESLLSSFVGAAPNSATSKVASSVQMGLENLIGDKILKGAYGVGRELIKGDVANPLLKEMGATYSMYQNRPVAEFIENVSDVFHRQKRKAIANVNTAAYEMANKVASRLTGRLPQDADSKAKFADLIKKQVDFVFAKTKEESTRAGTRAQEIADMMPVHIPSGAKTVTQQVPVAGVTGTVPGQVMQQQTSQAQNFIEVKGPIYLNDTLEHAYRIVRGAPKSIKTPDDQKQILHAANQLINNSGAKFDQAGKLTYVDPISFNDAWEAIKELDDLAYDGIKEGVVNPNSRLFKHLATKMRDDVEKSIPNWGQTPKDKLLANEALASWKNSKAIAATRNTIFDRATKIPKLLKDSTSVIPEIDAIVADPKQLEKAMRMGSLQLPTTAGPIIVATNVRKDLAGYEFQKIMKEAWTPTDPKNVTVGGFDKQKLTSALLDPDKKQSYDLLFSGPTKQRVEDFFEAVNKVAQSGKSAYAGAALARAGYAGITLVGSGLIAANLDDPRSRIAGAILGGTIGLSVVGRMMSSPKAASLLTAMVEGAPLGMSQQAAMKVVLNAAQGAKMSLSLSDGTMRDAMVTADGKVKLLD